MNFSAIKKVLKNELKQLDINLKILDLGCGTGEMSPFFQNYNYTGIDIEPEYIIYAKNNYGQDFRVMDGKNLKFKNNTFDFIFVVGVFHHLSDNNCKDIFNEILRVIKKSGKIIIIEDVDIKSKFDLFGNVVRKFDIGNFIRTKEEWLELISKKFTILKQYRIRSFIPTYEVFILSA